MNPHYYSGQGLLRYYLVAELWTGVCRSQGLVWRLCWIFIGLAGVFKLRARDERLTPVSDGYKVSGRERARAKCHLFRRDISQTV